MELLLVRHGESICSVDGVVGGERGCTGLTERGHAQAKALGERLATGEDVRGATVLCSTLPRAIQTGQAIAAAIGAGEPERVEDLDEFRIGEADGLTWDQARERFGRVDALAEPDTPVFPGAESLNAFRARVRTVLDDLAGRYDGTTVIAACHGGIIVGSMALLLNLPADRDARMYPEFTSITGWRSDAGGWALDRYNDAAHLRGTDLLPAP